MITQQWRKDYPGIIPHEPCKKKMMIIRKRQNDSACTNPFQETVYCWTNDLTHSPHHGQVIAQAMAETNY